VVDTRGGPVFVYYITAEVKNSLRQAICYSQCRDRKEDAFQHDSRADGLAHKFLPPLEFGLSQTLWPGLGSGLPQNIGDTSVHTVGIAQCILWNPERVRLLIGSCTGKSHKLKHLVDH